MNFLQSFTATVLLVTFLCFFCEALSPEGVFKKYTSLVTGLVISLSLVCAILQIRDVDFSKLELPQIAYDAPSSEAQDRVVGTQFALDLAARVEQSVAEAELGTIKAAAQVTVADGVVAVQALKVTCSPSQATSVCAHIRAQFGIEPEIV